MLIWVNHLELDDLADPLAIHALGALGEAGFHGRHAVVGSRQLFGALGKCVDISIAARTYFRWASEQMTQLGGLVARQHHVVVDFEVAHPAFVGGVWRIPLSFFHEQDYSAAAELLCENLNDCDFLEKFAEIFVRACLPQCVVKLRRVAGGGNTTADSLREALNNPRPFTFCVVDSDRDLPLGRIGETARRCLAVFVESWRVALTVVEHRELENMIPGPIMIDVLESVGGDASIVRELDLVAPDLSWFACFKSGEAPCRFHRVPLGHGGSARVRDALRITSTQHPHFRHCGADCGVCDCRIFPSLGENFLRSVVRWLSEGGVRRAAHSMGSWSHPFEELIRRVASFGLAFPRRNL